METMKVMRILSFRYVRIGDLRISYTVSDDYIQRTPHEIDSRIASIHDLPDDPIHHITEHRSDIIVSI